MVEMGKIMSDVATKKLFENEKVVVWEMTLDLGERTGVHTHKHDYFFQVISGSTLETLDSEGISLGEFEMETGSTSLPEPGWKRIDERRYQSPCYS